MKKRPLGVTFLTIIVVCIMVGNGLRIIETVFFWLTLEEYGAHPLYIAISGSVWFIAGLLLVWGLWQGKAWGWVAALVGSIGYPAWYWFDRLVLQKPHANWPFVLIAQIVFLISIYSILFSHRARRFLTKEPYEH